MMSALLLPFPLRTDFLEEAIERRLISWRKSVDKLLSGLLLGRGQLLTSLQSIFHPWAVEMSSHPAAFVKNCFALSILQSLNSLFDSYKGLRYNSNARANGGQ